MTASGIGGQAGVVQPGRQLFGAAAVALIEQHRVPAAPQRLVGQAAHVVRVARAFEAVQRQQQRPRGAVRLPVAVGRHLRVVAHLEQAALRARAAPGTAGASPTRRPSSRGRSAATAAGTNGEIEAGDVGSRHRRSYTTKR